MIIYRIQGVQPIGVRVIDIRLVRSTLRYAEMPTEKRPSIEQDRNLAVKKQKKNRCLSVGNNFVSSTGAVVVVVLRRNNRKIIFRTVHKCENT